MDKKLFVGPYLSCFFSVYSSDTEKIKLLINEPMTEEKANKELKRLQSEYEKGLVI